MKLCSKCKKRVAVVFITKLDNGETHNEGLCLKCAKDLGIQQVDQIIKNMGLTDEDLDAMSDEMETLQQQLGLFPQEADGQSAPAFPPIMSGMFSQKEQGADKENKKDKKELPNTAKHSYNATVTLPTCITRGKTVYTCGCGDSYVSDYVNAPHLDFDYTYKMENITISANDIHYST